MKYKIYEKEVEFEEEDPEYGEIYIYVPFDTIKEIIQKIKEQKK